MKRIWQSVWLVGLCAFVVHADRFVQSISTYAQGKKYDFTLTETALQVSPSWGKNQDFPPLSPRKALDAAFKLLAKLAVNPKEWQFRNVSLRETSVPDKWFYIVEYGRSNPPAPPGCVDCISGLETLQIVVLMNGHAVEPQVSEWPKK